MSLRAINRDNTDSSGASSWNNTDGSITKDGFNTGRNIIRCFDSNNCASGWSCVGGTCVQGPAEAGSNCGEEPNNNCGSSGSGDCTKSTCGDPGNSGGLACCGTYCCRRNNFGVTKCKCGPCPKPPPACSYFCDGYQRANGKKFANCSEIEACDECSICFNLFNEESIPFPRCVPISKFGGGFGTAPCFCESNKEPPGQCLKCSESGSWVQDWSKCNTCYTVDVNCGCASGIRKCCNPGGPSNAVKSDCETAALAECYKACNPPDDEKKPPDPCDGLCQGVSWCDGQPEPPCPPKTTCTDNGFISAGGKTCYIRTDCDKSNVPASCGECDCNCKNDCGNCQICNSNGECVADPACNMTYYSGIVIFLYEQACASNAFGNCTGGQESIPRYGRQGFITGNLSDPNDLGMSYGWQELSPIGPPTINPIYDDPDCNPSLGFWQGPYRSYRLLRSDGSYATGIPGSQNRKLRFEGVYTQKQVNSATVCTYRPGSTFAIFGFGNSSSEASADRRAKQDAQGYP